MKIGAATGASNYYKDVRAQRQERQTVLHKKDKRKGKQPASDNFYERRNAKASKGWGTRSGQPDCICRNYGLHEKAHGPALIFPGPTLKQLDTDDSAWQADVAMLQAEEFEERVAEIARASVTHCSQLGERDDHDRLGGMTVSLLDIVRPQRANKKSKRAYRDFDFVPSLPRVVAVTDDLSDIVSVGSASLADFDLDFDSDISEDEEWVDLYVETDNREAERPTYAQITKVEVT